MLGVIVIGFLAVLGFNAYLLATRFYSDVRTLVPLFRRCLELAIWLAAASVMMLQVRPVAPLATYGPRLIQVIGIFFVARVAAELVRLVIERSQGDRPGLTDLEKQQRATLIPLVTSLGRAAVYFVAGVLMLSVLGFNPIPLLAGAGILGVVIGFGAQPVINDLVSGFFILAESQFLVGDYIEVGTARGVVEVIQLRTTKIRDPNGQLHIVRNGQLAGVVNYSKRYTFAVVEIELPYAADLEKASAALRSVGEELRATHQDVLEPTTLEGVEKFGPSGVVLRTTTRVKPGTHGPVAREYRRRALEALRSMGLAPSPDIVPT